MMSEIRFYLALLWRRLPLLLLVSVMISVCGFFAAVTLPPVYQSQMRLIIESSQIPGNLLQSTVEVSPQEQIQLFQTRLLTRENLLDVANRLNVLPYQDDLNPDQIVQAMRAATTIRSSSGRNKATVMTLSFENPNPRMTARVLDEYTTFILAEDAQSRITRAGQTQEFFQQEVDRYNDQLSQKSAEILEFKTKNADALPEAQNYLREMSQNLQERLTQTTKDIASNIDQKERLQQIYEATGQVNSSGRTLSPQEKQIQDLKDQLAELKSVYSPTSARVVSLSNRIKQLELALANSSGSTPGGGDPAQAMYELQMADIDNKIADLESTRDLLTEQIASIQEQLSRVPANSLALSSLERDYQNIQAQYNQAVNRLSAASTGERIETLARGQRVSVVEQPSVPNEPIKPNRKKIAVMGVAAGLGAAGVLLFLLEFLSGTIKRSNDLVKGLGITPMITIPYMKTRSEIVRTRLTRIALSLAIGVAIPVAVWMVHTYYMPFDVIAQKVAARIGLYI